MRLLSYALGIFVNAFIVRMTLLPAIMTLLSKAAWWIPGWLDKVLPNLSIEGEVEEGTFHEEGQEVISNNDEPDMVKVK